MAFLIVTTVKTSNLAVHNMLFVFKVLISLVLNFSFVTFHIAETILRTFKCASQSAVLNSKLSHVHTSICSIEYYEPIFTLKENGHVTDMGIMYVELELIIYMQFMTHSNQTAIMFEPF
jgi:hypothetical protein